jgi:hypothetical protein
MGTNVELANGAGVSLLIVDLPLLVLADSPDEVTLMVN